ncbi:hypothetical protein Scep_029233 [Stephania cephalantha]|uniref:Auxin efflux carrier component n=1 Tax=Stephania cephalantha TaxID=152367 RepID=A0AAP0E0U9_9MAGN
MITLKDLYSVLSAVVPLYVTMFLAYMSVKWWKIFTPEQCAGINRFVAIFAVPLLSFEVISRINPYKMDHLFIAADIVSKLLLLLLLFMWAKFTKRGSLDWAVTLFSLASLPNTLVMGIPLLKSMYGDDKEALMVQVVVLQCIIWYTLMLFLFEYRAARIQVYNERNPINNITADIEGGGSEEATTLQGNNDKVDYKDTADGSGSGAAQEADVAVHVIVTRPSNSKPLDCADPQALQNINKVAPDSKRFNPLVTTTTATNNATDREDGLFMALQPRIIACGNRLAAYGMLVRFVAGPAIMSLASIVVGLKGSTLKVAIVQAALPQGIVPFVFAREYNLHPDVLSTA